MTTLTTNPASTCTTDGYESRHPLALPSDDPAPVLEAMVLPLTILGLAERFALHYGDHVAFVDGKWRVAYLAGEWDHASEEEAAEYAATAALSVVRSIGTVEYKAIGHYTGPGGGYNAAVKHKAAGQRFEDMENVAGRILGHARHLVPHAEFSEV
jgi:hypothetical protein